jgi:hypothetical protein
MLRESKFERELHIDIDENATPVKLSVRRVLVAMKSKLKEELHRLETFNCEL